MSTSPGTQTAIDFLAAFAPNGPWHLTAFAPNEAGMAGGHFGPHNREACVKWIEERNGRDNVYFHVNVSQTVAVKAKKTTSRRRATFMLISIPPKELIWKQNECEF